MILRPRGGLAEPVLEAADEAVHAEADEAAVEAARMT